MKIESPDGHTTELSSAEYAELLLALGLAHEHTYSPETAERFLRLYKKLGGEFECLYGRSDSTEGSP